MSHEGGSDLEGPPELDLDFPGRARLRARNVSESTLRFFVVCACLTLIAIFLIWRLPSCFCDAEPATEVTAATTPVAASALIL